MNRRVGTAHQTTITTIQLNLNLRTGAIRKKKAIAKDLADKTNSHPPFPFT